MRTYVCMCIWLQQVMPHACTCVNNEYKSTIRKNKTKSLPLAVLNLNAWWSSIYMNNQSMCFLHSFQVPLAQHFVNLDRQVDYLVVVLVSPWYYVPTVNCMLCRLEISFHISWCFAGILQSFSSYLAGSAEPLQPTVKFAVGYQNSYFVASKQRQQWEHLSWRSRAVLHLLYLRGFLHKLAINCKFCSWRSELQFCCIQTIKAMGASVLLSWRSCAGLHLPSSPRWSPPGLLMDPVLRPEKEVMVQDFEIWLIIHGLSFADRGTTAGEHMVLLIRLISGSKDGSWHQKWWWRLPWKLVCWVPARSFRVRKKKKSTYWWCLRRGQWHCCCIDEPALFASSEYD